MLTKTFALSTVSLSDLHSRSVASILGSTASNTTENLPKSLRSVSIILTVPANSSRRRNRLFPTWVTAPPFWSPLCARYRCPALRRQFASFVIFSLLVSIFAAASAAWSCLRSSSSRSGRRSFGEWRSDRRRFRHSSRDLGSMRSSRRRHYGRQWGISRPWGLRWNHFTQQTTKLNWNLPAWGVNPSSADEIKAGVWRGDWERNSRRGAAAIPTRLVIKGSASHI